MPRKGTARNFKKGSTKILTDTPVRNAITDARAQRHQKKSMTTAKKILFNKSRRQAAQEEAAQVVQLTMPGASCYILQKIFDQSLCHSADPNKWALTWHMTNMLKFILDTPANLFSPKHGYQEAKSKMWHRLPRSSLYEKMIVVYITVCITNR